MKAKEGVVDLLNGALTIELTAINQYFLNAKMCENWGMKRLHDVFRRMSLAEMEDTEELIAHILYLEGMPNVQRLNQVKIGEDVPETLQLALELELGAVDYLRGAIEHCQRVGDYNTRTKFEAMLADEEEHVDFFETELETLRLVGLENYLTNQTASAS